METMRKAADVSEKQLQPSVLDGRNQFPPGREFTLSIEFAVRAQSDLDMMDVGCRASTTSLCDVRWNGDCCFTHLISQTELFPLREVFGHIVNGVGEIHRLLPHDEIAEVDDV